MCHKKIIGVTCVLVEMSKTLIFGIQTSLLSRKAVSFGNIIKETLGATHIRVGYGHVSLSSRFV